jgi:hypothetical protein
MEDHPRYHTQPIALEGSHTLESLIAQAHARHQDMPDETGEQLLRQLPERLRELANQALNGPVDGVDLAYTLAMLIDRIEQALAECNGRCH